MCRNRYKWEEPDLEADEGVRIELDAHRRKVVTA